MRPIRILGGPQTPGVRRIMRRKHLLCSVGALLVLQAAGALYAAALIALLEMCLAGDSSQIYEREFLDIFGRVNLSW